MTLLSSRGLEKRDAPNRLLPLLLIPMHTSLRIIFSFDRRRNPGRYQGSMRHLHRSHWGAGRLRVLSMRHRRSILRKRAGTRGRNARPRLGRWGTTRHGPSLYLPRPAETNSHHPGRPYLLGIIADPDSPRLLLRFSRPKGFKTPRLYISTHAHTQAYRLRGGASVLFEGKSGPTNAASRRPEPHRDWNT